MFAVLKTGGKQYKVSPGDILRVEKLHASSGDKIQFNNILMVGGSKSTVGTPLVKDAAVQAEVIEQIKGDKVINFVKRRRKHSSKRTKGHRQQLTLLRITDILASGASKTGVKEALNGGGLEISYDSLPGSSETKAASVKQEKARAASKKAAPAKEVKAKVDPKKAAPAKEVKAKVEPKKAAPAKEVKAKVEPKKAAPAKEVKAKVEPKKADSAKKAKAQPTSNAVKKVTKENKDGS